MMHLNNGGFAYDGFFRYSGVSLYYEETKFLVQIGFMRWSGFDRCGETSSSTKIKPATKYYVGSFSSYYYYSDVVGCFQTKSTEQ